MDFVLYLEPNFEFGLRLELELELGPEGLDRDRKSEETMYREDGRFWYRCACLIF